MIVRTRGILGAERGERPSRRGASRWIARTSAAIALGALVWVSSAPTTRATDRATRRVLFIGNSYTRFNDLPRMVEALSREAPRGPLLDTSRATHGGFNLRMHWRDRELRRRIASGGFDVVVLQAHSLSPLDAPEQATEYARRFARHVSAAGARLILFQTWARAPRSRAYGELEVDGPDEMLARIDAFYSDLGRELHVSVAPVGRAWRLASETLPRVRLHRPDGTHPALAGTYLAACVLYGTLTGADPRETSWRPWRLSRSKGARIRAVAAEALGLE